MADQDLLKRFENFRLAASRGLLAYAANIVTGPEKKRVPIVVVERSGKAADFMACTWRHFHGEAKKNNLTQNSQEMQDTVEYRLCRGPGCVYSYCVLLSQPQSGPEGSEKVECEYLQAKFNEYFGPTKDSEQLLPQFVEACKRKDAVTVYHLDKSSSLSHAILKRVCKGPIQNNGKPYTSFEALSILEKWN
jgi:hypothetical protein